ncbi:winged helix-turn-helix transcriptional regulator [Streptomyces sp. URMC 126]|uniref:winged helix-turn-helix transcriptional regulator n=1 Tax=Streptomyces sp. URMC 126 TaxID=3423401 RepID=UPI003F1BC104
MHVIEGKWKVLVLWELRDGPRRFGALRRSLPGVSEKVLTQQLRELETDGIVHRRVHETVPPKVEYSLTEDGRDLNAALAPLGAWGARRVLPPDAQASAAADTVTDKATDKAA